MLLPAEPRMEPMLIREDNPEMASLADLAWQLGQESSRMASRQSSEVKGAVAKLVRAMNCYYSNLIEGHNTLPIDIDRALANQFQENSARRDLQTEALAHIEVQRWLDEEDGLAELGFGTAGIREIHRRLYSELPAHMHMVIHPTTREPLSNTPGNFRETNVIVGRHIPVAPEDIQPCMDRWESAYAQLPPRLLPMAAAAAHHRLLWIHPMLDGNGRVARLVTHAMLKKAINGVELWSVSRGFAREKDRYKYLLKCCDHPRRGDSDGRGELSESSLVDFTRYFLTKALDQVRLMTETLKSDNFTRGLLEWIRSQPDIARGDKIIEQIILYGSIARGEVPALLQMPERSARRVVQNLTDHFLLVSDSHRAPLRLNLPLYMAQAVFPCLVEGSAV